jgi:hypothetical protein
VPTQKYSRRRFVLGGVSRLRLSYAEVEIQNPPSIKIVAKLFNLEYQQSITMVSLGIKV